jgi:cytochrome c-type biogenesis protein CcmH
VIALLLLSSLALADIAPGRPAPAPPKPTLILPPADPSAAPAAAEPSAAPAAAEPSAAPEAAEPSAAPEAAEPSAAPEADDEPVDIPGLPPGPPPPADQVESMAREIGSGLRCPVCQGLSVADSTSNAAVLMQRRIQELVRQGYTKVEIEDYFVGRYGEWVLLFPRGAGMNRLVWIGPLLATGLGLLIATTFLKGGRAAPTPPTKAPSGSDPYVDRLLREVDDE